MKNYTQTNYFKIYLLIAFLFVFGYSSYAQPGSVTTLSCGVSSSQSLTTNGFTGSDPSATTGSCGQCCYQGSDLDGDGDQDVSYSVENSKWYKYCNPSNTNPITITFIVDETNNNCNIQGAVFVTAGTSSNGATDALDIDCSNQAYQSYDSNPGGNADGFTFSNVTIPAGGCAWLMVDGYGGATCGGYTVQTVCPCTPPTISVSAANSTICSGSSTTLTASCSSGCTGIVYTWTPNGTLSSGSGATVTATPTTTTTYTVTGTAGGCSATATVTVTVTPATTAGTLSGNQAICVAGTTTFTSTVSGGTWSSSNTGIATVNASTGLITGVTAGTATITYTVVGTGGCPNATVTRTVTVTAAPNAGTLSGNQAICAAGTTTFSSTTSGGTWSSSNTGIATVNAATGLITGVTAGTATITYTVAGTGGCANATATRTVTVTAAPNPGTLSGNQTICITGTTTFSSTTSGGTWSSSNTGIATVNAATGVIVGVTAGTTNIIYTVTGTGGCADATATRTVTVTTNIIPTFITPAPICTGTTAPTLSLTSIDGINGTWSPSVVSNTLSGTYTFTPYPNQCATTTTISVTVYQDCSFGSYASAVWLTNCEDNNFFNTVGSGTSIIGPAQNIFPNTDFGTYISNSNTFKLRGAEVKTFKSVNSNVCSARLNYRIYPQAGTPGAFTVLNLPFFDNCSGATFPSGGPCTTGDQKWQRVLNDAQFPVDLTAFPAGDYVLEVYYDITGDVNSTTQCDDTVYINNNGNNYIATYTLQDNPTYTSINPTICNGNDGSITIQSLAPNTAYTMTYTYNSAVVGPLTINTNGSGQYTLSGLTVGDYANFNYVVNGCTFASSNVITLSVQSTVQISSTNPLTCNSNTGTITISSLIPNQTYAVTYSDDTVVVGPTTMTADAGGQIVLNGLNAGTYTNFSLTTAYCSATATQVATLVDPPSPVVTVNSSTICSGQLTTITATPQVPGNYIYTWTVPAGFTNPGDVDNFSTTVAGTYTVVITSAGCSSPAASGTVTFLPTVTLNLTSANDNQTVCIVNAITSITFASANATDVTVTGLPNGVSGSFNAGTGVFTISGTSSQSGTFPYTVSTVGGCNTVTLNGTIVVNTTVTATFAPITICSGDAVSLPTNSIEGYSGTWLPSIASNTQSGTYTFTPTASACATSGSLTITVNQPTPSTFAAIPAICNGDTAPLLPATSIEGFSGTWLPSLVSNTLSNTYIFTPLSSQCASSGSISVTVNQKTTPTFNAIAPLCTGETAPSLPLASIEGITGTWTPAAIDNTQTDTYTFVPYAGQCANNGSLAVTVQTGFDIELSGSCVGDDFVIKVTAVNNSIDLSSASFDWFNGNGQAVGNDSSTFNVTEYLNSTTATEELPITFSVTVTNSEGCYKSEPITLVRIFCGIQKGISVNNDGANDFLDLTQMNVKHLSIYNRYGMKAYSKSGYTNEWKGQSDKGDELPDGTYYYVIDFNDNLPARTGWIYINREN